ncbi:MAG TPA: hypothetical protein VEV43_15785 [Actinomycetota bacterium]|nr:hypothetical protein [Actinomycetota bacterium]
MNDFERNKAWADGHRAEIQKVLRQVAARHLEVDTSSFERDTQDAIDYEVAMRERNVACRVRHVTSCGGLRELTLGTSLRGSWSEVMKLAKGHVDWYLYAWSDDDRFVDWMVVDVPRVLAEGLIDRAMEDRREVPLPRSYFVPITVAELARADAIVAASWMP